MSKCTEYNSFSVLCADCEYPADIKCCKSEPKTKEELDVELCEYCPCTDYGLTKINNEPRNLCEGINCKKAYENYLEQYEEEEE